MIYGDTPFPTKFWGLYKFSVEGRRTLKREIAREIYNYFCMKDPHPFDAFFLTAYNKLMTTNPRDNHFKGVCYDYKRAEKRDEALSRFRRFTTIFVVHKCDANGLWIPTKEEIANAIAEHFRKGDEEKIKDDLKKYIN